MLLPLIADDGAGRGVGFEGVRLSDEGVATLATLIVSRASSLSAVVLVVFLFGAGAVVLEEARVLCGLSGIVSSFLRFADRGDSIVACVCDVGHDIWSSRILVLICCQESPSSLVEAAELCPSSQ